MISNYLRNVDGKAVVRGFSLPVVISEEAKEEESNRLAVRSALQQALQSRSTLPSSPIIKTSTEERIEAIEEVVGSEDDDPLTRDNPAYLAGVRLNDVILSVNNIDARSSSFEQILRALTGSTYTSRNIEETHLDTVSNSNTTATSGIMHPCHGQPSGSRGMAIVAVDHIVCITFARPQMIHTDTVTPSLSLSSSTLSAPDSLTSSTMSEFASFSYSSATPSSFATSSSSSANPLSSFSSSSSMSLPLSSSYSAVEPSSTSAETSKADTSTSITTSTIITAAIYNQTVIEEDESDNEDNKIRNQDKIRDGNKDGDGDGDGNKDGDGDGDGNKDGDGDGKKDGDGDGNKDGDGGSKIIISTAPNAVTALTLELDKTETEELMEDNLNNFDNIEPLPSDSTHVFSSMLFRPSPYHSHTDPTSSSLATVRPRKGPGAR